MFGVVMQDKRYRYTFENRCLEDSELAFGDRTRKVIVNTKGGKDEIHPELKEILDYLENGKVAGVYTKQLDEAVKLFEEGAKLAAFCNKALKDAELKLTQLSVAEDSGNDE